MKPSNADWHLAAVILGFKDYNAARAEGYVRRALRVLAARLAEHRADGVEVAFRAGFEAGVDYEAHSTRGLSTDPHVNNEEEALAAFLNEKGHKTQ